jgi:hypothetical protein
MEALHYEHEEHGREKVPLPNTATMANSFPGGAIEKDSSTSSGMNGGYSVDRIAWTPNHQSTTRRSRRKTHPTESKALARSIFNMI